MLTASTTVTTCYHCHEDCDEQIVKFDDKAFCCEGCKLVYELLDNNDLCQYYDLDDAAGLSLKNVKHLEGKFDFLNDAELQKSFIQFQNDAEIHVLFYLPTMHCSSCVYLLENLHRLDKRIIHAQVNFPKKELTVIYNHADIQLSEVAKLLAQIGYEPHLGLDNAEASRTRSYTKKQVIKIGIAGFAFGNIMMLSFPEYFSLGNYFDEQYFTRWFGYLNIVLALPVFFYAASEFFVSGIGSLRKGILNIDLPIALAILITFSRSLYEILSHTGAGYLDSMAGIVFFMLIGRYFQDRTYDTLSFERDYKSFFPLSITQVKKGNEHSVPVTNLKEGDIIIVRNNEIIPCDSILLKGPAAIDYSFVSGESRLQNKAITELVYAGGRQKGGALTLQVVKEVSQSYLTRLWNKEEVQFEKESRRSYTEIISKYFTWVLFALTAISFAYWYNIDLQKAINVATTTLIVACPCALLLSASFTNGNIIRHFGRHRFYLKNAGVIEKLELVDTIVFDKTGTITNATESDISYHGSVLSESDKKLLITALRNSSHPLSMRIAKSFVDIVPFENFSFEELEGKGLRLNIEGQELLLGSQHFVTGERHFVQEGTEVHLSINSVYSGYFRISNQYREGLWSLLKGMQQKFEVFVLSGDNNSEKEFIDAQLGCTEHSLFNQSPESKLQFVKALQQSGKKVMMLGDGLNDSGALLQSDVGLAVTEQSNYMSPASDVIMHGSVFAGLGRFIEYASWSRRIVVASFVISLLYNVVGLGFALQGMLSPVVAAILMPISSISIVLFTTISSSLIAAIRLPKI